MGDGQQSQGGDPRPGGCLAGCALFALVTSLSFAAVVHWLPSLAVALVVWPISLIVTIGDGLRGPQLAVNVDVALFAAFVAGTWMIVVAVVARHESTRRRRGRAAAGAAVAGIAIAGLLGAEAWPRLNDSDLVAAAAVVHGWDVSDRSGLSARCLDALTRRATERRFGSDARPYLDEIDGSTCVCMADALHSLNEWFGPGELDGAMGHRGNRLVGLERSPDAQSVTVTVQSRSVFGVPFATRVHRCPGAEGRAWPHGPFAPR